MSWPRFLLLNWRGERNFDSLVTEWNVGVRRGEKKVSAELSEPPMRRREPEALYLVLPQRTVKRGPFYWTSSTLSDMHNP